MVGGTDYSKQPVQPRDPGAPAAGLGLQAVHPGDGPRAGPLPRSGLHVGAAADPVQGGGPERRKGGAEGPARAVQGAATTATSTSGSASIATATTYSDNSVYSQLGMSLAAAPAASPATANKMGIQTDLATTTGREVLGQRQPLRAVQPGADPRRAGDRRLPARDGARLRDAQHNGQIVSGTMADSPTGPVGIQRVDDSRRRPRGDQPAATPARTRSRPSRSSRPSVAATARHPPTQRGHVGTGTQRLHRRPVPSRARPARPRTTATPGSSAPTRT